MGGTRKPRTAEEAPPIVQGGKLWQVSQYKLDDTGRPKVRACSLANGVWEPGSWVDAQPGSSLSRPGLYVGDVRVSGPPRPSWGSMGGWDKLVELPPPTSLASARDELTALQSVVPGTVAIEWEEATQARYADWPGWVSPLREVAKGLPAQPYAHQADAMDHLHAGRHLALATGTASGKSLCYQLPVLDLLRTNPQARVLYVAPAKALCDDQLAAWGGLLGVERSGDAPEVEVGAWGRTLRLLRYDRDTKGSLAAPQEAQVVLTNSSMLHRMLARREEWQDFVAGLRLVVLDEVHAARGAAGANLAWILRRLRRVAARSGGGGIQFACCSATIGNPGQLASQLIGDGKPVAVVDHDTAGHGGKLYVSWTPPVAGDKGQRGTVAIDIVKQLIGRDAGPLQTIAFHRSRPEATRTARYLAKGLCASGRSFLGEALETYVSNYTSDRRHGILESLKGGQCPAIFATSALELGIDLGDLSAAVIVGIPHSRAGFRQEAGRVGRRAGRESIVVFIPRFNALDDWFAHPDHFGPELVSAPPESVITSPDNDEIARLHLAAAMKEIPLDPKADAPFFGKDRVEGALRLLEQTGEIGRDESGLWQWVSKDDPHSRINVLGSKGSYTVQVRVQETGEVLGEVDNATALWMLFPGAVYEDGIRDSYVVESLHLGKIGGTPWRPGQHNRQRVAWVRDAQGGERDSFTRAITERDYRAGPDAVISTTRLGSLPVHHGPIVLSTVLAKEYWVVQNATGKDRSATGQERCSKRKRPGSPTAVGPDGKETPYEQLELQTAGVWFAVPDAALAAVTAACQTDDERRREEHLLGALHGAEHLLCKMTGTLDGFFEDDIGGLSAYNHPMTDGKPGILLHESAPGGLGLVQRLLEGDNFKQILQRALEVVSTCPCEDGCPHCLLDRLCGSNNEWLDKKATQVLLEALARAVSGTETA